MVTKSKREHKEVNLYCVNHLEANAFRFVRFVLICMMHFQIAIDKQESEDTENCSANMNGILFPSKRMG